MQYSDGHFAGMHLIWWIIWMVIIIWAFIVPQKSFYRRSHKESPDEILNRRFASGEISKEEFDESIRILNSDYR